jgi:hypothetical protein
MGNARRKNLPNDELYSRWNIKCRRKVTKMADWTLKLSEKFKKYELEKSRIVDLINEIENELQIIIAEVQTNPVLSNSKWQRGPRSAQFNPHWNIFINGANTSFSREEVEVERHALKRVEGGYEGYEETLLGVNETLRNMLISKISWDIPE